MARASSLRKLPPLHDPQSAHDRRKALKLREREAALARVEQKRAAKTTGLAKMQLPAVSPHPTPPVAPPVRRGKVKPRHRIVFLSFVICVLGTNLLAAWYLWERAADRYVSAMGFSIRTEQVSSAFELLGGMAELSGSGSSDEDILYQFIQSHQMVRIIDEALDLRHIWSTPDPEIDPVFSYHPPGSIEDLTDYWSRMVSVYKDNSSGLIELEVQAFAPEDARNIAQMIYDQSSLLINRLSDIAREDSTRHAREELEDAVQRLKIARSDVTRFRNENQLVSPDATLQIQTGLLASLETQMAETLIEIDMLAQTTRPSDPRVTQAERRRSVIEERLHEERSKLGIGASDGQSGSRFADLVGEFESLSVDREFAEVSYTAALAAYDAAVAESRRQTRYLAAHISPTLAEKSVYPDRWGTMASIAFFSLLIWAMCVMVAYSLRDRR